jgi:hypothetical protein
MSLQDDSRSIVVEYYEFSVVELARIKILILNVIYVK